MSALNDVSDDDDSSDCERILKYLTGCDYLISQLWEECKILSSLNSALAMNLPDKLLPYVPQYIPQKTGPLATPLTPIAPALPTLLQEQSIANTADTFLVSYSCSRLFSWKIGKRRLLNRSCTTFLFMSCYKEKIKAKDKERSIIG